MINRLFTNIVSNVGNNIQDTSTSMQTIIKNYVNDIYFDLLKQIDWQAINDDYSLTTVSGTSDYPLPYNFSKEIYVYDATNKIEISPIDMQQLVRDYAASVDSTGTVERYLIVNKQVRNQPSSSSTLSIVSSSAADSTQTVRVKGIDSNGVELDESVTLNGTTPAVTSNSYEEIVSISKSATTTGRVTITSNSGAVTVAIMSPADLAYRVIAIRFHYTPIGAYTIRIPYIIAPMPLSSDYDQPIVDCADVLELGATMKAWRYKRQMAKAVEYERQYKEAVQTLIWNKENSFNISKKVGITPYPRNDY